MTALTDTQSHIPTVRGIETQLIAARDRYYRAKAACRKNRNTATIAEYLDAIADLNRLSREPAVSLAGAKS